MQHVVIGFCALGDCNELMFWRSLLWLATGSKIWPWSADRVLNNVGEERGKHNANDETENRNMSRVYTRSETDGPEGDYT